MIDPVRLYAKILKRKRLLRLGNLHAVDLKGQLRRNHPQGINHSGQSLRPDHEKGICTLRIAHGEQHARKAADMIRMKMSEADHIDGFRAPALLLHGDLRALSAVNQYACTVIPRHQRGKPSVGQGHHPPRPQQADIQHVYNSSFLSRLSTGTQKWAVSFS